MSSSARALLLLLAMLWQTLAWVTPHGVSAHADEVAHLTVHGQALEHHHHVDASLHMAETVGSDIHLHADGGAQAVGLHEAPGRPIMVAETADLPLWIGRAPLTVVLDGLLRPPQSHS